MKHTTIFKLAILTVTLASSLGLADQLSATGNYTTTTYATPHATGYLHDQKGIAFMPGVQRQHFAGVTVPGKFSLRRKVGPVEDQGQCGSCWDFSLTSALRGTWIAHGKDPGRLSFNYLLNCDKTQQGCNGGDFSAAAMFVTPKGAPAYGSDGGYSAIDGKCEPKPAVASTISYKLLGDDGGLYPKAPTPSFQDIAYVVGVLHQPVSIDVAVTDAWQAYRSGLYDGCDDQAEKDINHMVIIEGYSCEKSVDKSGNCVFDDKGNLPNGVGRWVIRNSWGSSWGDDGYITMRATNSKGQKCNMVANDALYFDVTGN